MKTSSFISIIYLCLASMVLLLMPIGQALAADITVDADCSLQNAILSANEQDMAEPMADCETGDDDDGSTQVDDDGNEIPAGEDTIAIDVAGTVEGVITLDATLAITTNIVIEGGGYAIDGAGNQIFSVTAGSLTANNLNIRNGWTEGNGGAISAANAAVTLNNSVVSGSGAKVLGGGIYALDSDLTLIDSVVSGNATGVLTKPEPPPEAEDLCHQHAGSGAHAHAEEQCHAHEQDNAQSRPTEEPAAEPTTEPTQDPITWDTSGGGVFFEGLENNLIIDKSGVDTNATPANGGGVYIASGRARITNSTISENSAGADGGGLYNAGDAALTHVTVVHNRAATTGGVVDAAMLLLHNSILAHNEGGDCSGTLNATIGNLIRDLSCRHDGLGEDPFLLLLGGSPSYYLPQEGSRALDSASAEYCLPTDQRGIDRAPDTCDIGAAEHQPGVFNFQIQSALALLNPPDSGGSSSSSSAAQRTASRPEPAPQPTSAPSTCASMPSHISIYGFRNNTACKVLDEGGVANQTILDYGFFYAVDIFGDLSSTVVTCFQHGPGIIILLDAANSPRNIVPLRARLQSGMICADVTRPGSVVLMPEAFWQTGYAPKPIWELSGCTVTTTDILNLRSEPNAASAIVANVLNDVQLTADMKADNYFRVNYYQILGWLSGDYLAKSGNC